MDVLILFISGIALGIAYILEKKLSSEKFHPVTFTFLISAVSSVIAIPLLFYHFRVAPISFIWFVALLSVTAYGLGWLSNFYAYKLIDASVVGLIQRLNLIVAAFVGIVFLTESYNTRSYIGFFCILLGSIVIMFEKGKFRISRGIVFAIFAAIGMGLAAVFDKIVLKQFSPFSYVFVNNLLATLFFLPFKSARRDVRALWKKSSHWIVGAAFFSVSNWVGFLYVLAHGSVSRVFPIYDSLGLVVIVILGITLLKEKSRIVQKILGCLVVILGVFLLG